MNNDTILARLGTIEELTEQLQRHAAHRQLLLNDILNLLNDMKPYAWHDLEFAAIFWPIHTKILELAKL